MSGSSKVGAVSVSVNTTPQADDDTFSSFEELLAYLDVLANDEGGQSKSLYSLSSDLIVEDGGDSTAESMIAAGQIYSITTGLGATATIVTSGEYAGTIEYDSSTLDFLAEGEVATDIFSYIIQLGNGTYSIATVTITITGTNDAPTVVAALSAAADEDAAGFTLDLLEGADDVDNGAVLSVTNVAGLVPGVSLAGTTLNVDPSDPAFQALALGETQVITVTYDVVDEHGASVAQSATITITGTNDAPTVAAALSAAADEDAAGFTLDLLEGADDVDNGAVLSVANVAGLVPGVSLAGTTLSVDPSDQAFQALALGETQVITVTYDVVDEHGASVAQSATITITGTNDAPTVVAALSAAADEDAAGFTLDLLEGADDVDNGAVLSVANVAGLVPGVSLAGTTLSVDPSDQAFQALALGETQVITVTYDVVDEHGASVAQSATITITGTNDAPTVQAINLNTLDALSAGQIILSELDNDSGIIEVIDFLVDTDGDGDLDTANTAEIYTWATQDAYSYGIGVGDLNNDGMVDLAVARGRSVVVFQSLGDTDGNGIENYATTDLDLPGSAFTFDAELVDMDGDGLSDIVVAANSSDNSVYWFRNVGDINADGINEFAGAVQLAILASGTSYGIDASDLDNDGDIDLVVPRWSGGPITVLYNLGNDGGGNPILGADIINDSFGSASANTNIADLDGDGDQDFVLTRWGASENAAYFNLGDVDGDGFVEFSTVALSISSSPKSSIDSAIGDIDGDGDLDIVYSTFAGFVVAKNVGDLEGDGLPNYETQEVLPSFIGRFYGIELSDADGDGDLDVLLADDTRGLVVASNLGDPDADGVFDFSFEIIPGTPRGFDVRVLNGGSASIAEDGPPVTAAFAGDDVDSNDEQASLTYTVLTDPTEGIVTNNGDGTFSFDPGSDFQDLAKDETRKVSFDYKATDLHGADSGVESVSIEVAGTNDAPTVAAALSAAADEDAAGFTLDLLEGADDVDNGAVLSVTNVAGLVPGVSLAGTTLNVDPSDPAFQALALGETQVITVTYDVVDEHGASVAQSATITITGTNDAPVANDDVIVGEATPVGAEFLVNTETSNTQDRPSVTALADGGFVVTWESYGQDGSTWGIYGQSYDAAGEAVGAEFQINSYTTGDQDEPSVAALVDGGFVVTWISDGQDGSGSGIFGQRYDAAGAAVGGEFQVNTYTSSTQWFPSVTGLADGGFVVAWSSLGQDGSSYGIFGQRYDSAGVTVGSEFRINSYVGNIQFQPSVTALADGGFFAAWISYGQDGSSYGIFGQRYDATGEAVGAEFQINSYTADSQALPSVAGLTDGGFVVTWGSNGQDGSSSGVFGQRYDATGATVGVEFQINTYTSSFQGEPSVTALADGGFVVTWISDGQDGSGSGIFGQRYDAAGAAVGAEFQINTRSGATQYQPSVTALADGGFVATWASYNQDGSNYGVYGQRYAVSSFDEDTVAVIDGATLLENDSDADGDALTIVSVSATSTLGASVTLKPDGTITYDPNGQFEHLAVGETATDTFTYTIDDGNGGTSTATVSITVSGANDAPIALDIAGSADEDGPTILLTADYSDPDTSDSHIISIDTSGTTGLVTDNGDGTFSYDPNGQFEYLAVGDSATDTFSYMVSDGNGGTDIATATITITGTNDLPFLFPKAGDDLTRTIYDTSDPSPEGWIAAKVYVNFTDPDQGDHHTGSGSFISSSNDTRLGIFGGSGNVPVSATAPGEALGIYQIWGPKLDQLAQGEVVTEVGRLFVLDDSSGAFSPLTAGHIDMTFTLIGANDTPIAMADQAAADEDDALISGSVASNDSDVDNGAVLSFALVNPAPAGFLFNADGSWSFDPSDPSYQSLAEGQSLELDIAYTVTDEHGATGASTLTIGITGTNDAPVVTAIDAGAVGEDDAPVTINLLAGQSDPDGDILSATNISVTDDLGTAVAFVDNGDGTISIDPQQYEALNDGESRTLTVGYDVSDGHTTSANSASLVVNGATDNFAPLASDDGGIIMPAPAGSEFQINSYASGEQRQPVVAALTDGGFVSIWMSYGQDGSGWGIFGQRYDQSGTSVGAEFQVNSYTLSDQASPALTALPNGGFVVTWDSNNQDATGDTGVYGQRFASDGTRAGGEFHANSTISGTQVVSSITSLADGGFVVAWTSYGQDGSGAGVFGQRYDQDGAKVGTEFRANSNTTGDQAIPVVTGLADGGFIVTWRSAGQDGNGFGIYGQRYDSSGAPVGSEFRINSSTLNDQTEQVVASLGDGGFVVAWSSFDGDGSSWSILAQRFDADGNPIGPEFLVNDYTSDVQEQPSISALPDGGFVVSWQSLGQDGSGYGTYAQRFDSEGLPIGNEFRVNSETANDQWFPSVAALPNGGIIVVWESNLQDGSGHGIFGQLFSSGFATDENSTFVLGSGDLLANDSDADGDVLTIVSVSGTSTLGASVTLNPDGTITYDPNGQFEHLAVGESANDTFAYTIDDGNGGTDTATVSIAVSGKNDAPVSADDAYETEEDTVLSIAAAGVLANDSDVDGDVLSTVLVSDVSHGALVLNADGSFDYTPNADFNGADSFTYKANDGSADSNTVTVDITVKPVNDAPTGSNLFIVFNEDENHHPSPGDFGFIDSDAGDTLSGVVITTLPAVGVLTLSGTPVAAGDVVTVADIQGGLLAFTPLSNEYGSPYTTFTFQVFDQDGALDPTPNTLTYRVQPVNDAPTAVDINGSAHEDGPAIVLAADYSDPDTSDNHVISVDTTSTVGLVTDNGDGTFSYDPNGAFEHLNDGETATDTFTYMVDDGNGGVSTATGTVTITGANDNAAPVANDDVVVGEATPAGAEFQVHTYTTSHQEQPSVTALADGGFVTTWTSNGQDGSGNGIYGQRYDASGVAVGPEFQVNTYTTSYQIKPSVSALADGGFVTTWASNGQDGDGYGIFGQRYDASGVAVGPEFQVNTYTTSYQIEPSVTALADGGFVVTWADSGGQDGDGYGIFGQRYDVSGGPVGVEFQINSYTTSDQYQPSVTALADGGFVVTWISYGQDGSSVGIFGQRYDTSGVAVGAELQINTYTSDSQQLPSVAALADGGFVVTWVSFGQDGDAYGVFGQRYDASGAAVGAEFQVNTYTTNQQLQPSVTALADGGFVVAWQSYGQDGSVYEIYAQRYDASGAAVGPEFQVNTYTSNNQVEPSLAALADGGFVVTWASNGQDGSDYGIFGQRYVVSNFDEDTVSVIDGTALLENDSDADGEALTIVSVSATSTLGASVTLNPDGTITYDPTGSTEIGALVDGETATDTFTYTVDDGNGGTDTATVSITVNGVTEAGTTETGTSGADSFVFALEGTNEIVDFEAGIDTLELTGLSVAFADLDTDGDGTLEDGEGNGDISITQTIDGLLISDADGSLLLRGENGLAEADLVLA